MIRSIEWSKFLIEGLVIVVSILLAFGIEAWWQDNQDTNREIELLEGINSDFLENRNRLLAQLDSIEQNMQSLSAFIGMSPTEVRLIDPELAWGTVVFPIIRTYTEGGMSYAVLDSTKNSGMLTLISSPELRRKLADTENIRNAISNLRSLLLTYTEQAIAELGRDADALRQTWDDDFRFSVVSRASLIEIKDNEKLMSLITAKLSRFNAYQFNLNLMLSHIDDVIQTIDMELERL